jgi:hypothetical protein
MSHPPIPPTEDLVYYYPPIYVWVFQVVSLPQVSLPKPCMHFSHTRATCPSNLTVLDFITRMTFGEQYRSLSSSLCSLHRSPVSSSLLDPNILLNTLFSNILNLRSSLNNSEQVSRPHKTTDKIIVLYTHILVFKCLDSKLEDKRFCTEY